MSASKITYSIGQLQLLADLLRLNKWKFSRALTVALEMGDLWPELQTKTRTLFVLECLENLKLIKEGEKSGFPEGIDKLLIPTLTAE